MTIFMFAGGLMGAAGVGLSAYGAHAGGGTVATAAQFLLFHAPLFVALGLAGHPSRTRTAGGGLWAYGLAAVSAATCCLRHFCRHADCFRWQHPAGGLFR